MELISRSVNIISYSMQNRLRGSGHGVAAARMDAMLNIAGWMSEQMGGLRLELDNSLFDFNPPLFLVLILIENKLYSHLRT